MSKDPAPSRTRQIGAITVVALLLGLVALASISYAGYRMSQGADDNAALLIGGGMCAALAAIFAGRENAASRKRDQ